MDQFWSKFLSHLGEASIYLLLLLTPALTKKFKQLWKKQSNALFFNTKIKKDVDDIVNNLRIRFGANRACLLEFSNTEHSIAGFPFEFVRMTYEKVLHLESIKDRYEKKHITEYAEALLLVGEDNVMFCVINAQDPNVPEGLRFWMEDLGVRWMILHKLSRQLNTGLMVLQFSNDFRVKTPQGELFAEDRDYLKFHCLKVLKLLKSLK